MNQKLRGGIKFLALQYKSAALFQFLTRALLAFAGTHNMGATQIDFDGAYLNGTIDSDICMEQYGVRRHPVNVFYFDVF